MVGTGQVEGTTVRVRARASVFRNGVFAVIAAGIPLFAVLYWLSFSQGNWHLVLLVQFIYLGFFAVVFVRHFAAFVEVTPTTITKQALVVRTVIDRADVASVYVIDTHSSSSTDSLPQLLALDAEDRRLLRMRGTFWSREDMLTIAEAIGAPLTVETQPMTLAEFYALRPGIAYWYEGKLWLTVLGIVLAFAASYFLLSALMTAIGVPSLLGL